MLNSLLKRVAQEYVASGADLLPIMGRRKERLGWGKRPAPIETDAVMRAGARQFKAIAHTDRVGAARRDRQSAGVVIHELMYAAIAIGGNAFGQVVGANLSCSIRLCVSIDNRLPLASAGDGDSRGELGALVSGDDEVRRASDHLMVGGWGCHGR